MVARGCHYTEVPVHNLIAISETRDQTETSQHHQASGGDIYCTLSNSVCLRSLCYECQDAVTGGVCRVMAEFQDRNLAADSVKKHYVLICLPGQGVIRLSPDLGTTYQYRGEG